MVLPRDVRKKRIAAPGIKTTKNNTNRRRNIFLMKEILLSLKISIIQIVLTRITIQTNPGKNFLKNLFLNMLH
jgi:hypothetical protein